MARRERGFTLIEGVFSMFLIFLVLGALAYTLRQAGQVKSNLKNMGELSEIVQVMSLLKSDIWAATRVVAPAQGSGSGTVSVTRIDPSLPIQTRINDVDDLNPFDAVDEARVDYVLEEGLLKRRFTNSLGVESVERLIRVEDFQARREAGEAAVTVTFEVTNTRRPDRHSLKVALR